MQCRISKICRIYGISSICIEFVGRTCRKCSAESIGYLQSVESEGYLQSVESIGYLKSVESIGYLQSVESKGYLQSVESGISAICRIWDICNLEGLQV